MFRVCRGDDGASAEGSGRVAVHLATGAARCYTLECNYNGGRMTNHVPAAAARGPAAPVAGGRAPSPERRSELRDPPKYGPTTWRDVGKAAAVALLDASGDNMWSRLLGSRFRNISRMRSWLMSEIRARKCYQNPAPPAATAAAPPAAPLGERGNPARVSAARQKAPALPVPPAGGENRPEAAAAVAEDEGAGWSMSFDMAKKKRRPRGRMRGSAGSRIPQHRSRAGADAAAVAGATGGGATGDANAAAVAGAAVV